MDHDNPVQPEEPVQSTGPGERLREARLRHGLEIKWIAAQLHIREWMLEAMEANQFDRITPPVFVRGYLTNYARFLEEPEDEILAMYRSCCGEEERVERKVVRATTQDFTSVEDGAPGMKKATWGVVLIVVILFAGWGATKFIGSIDIKMDVDAEGMVNRVAELIPFMGNEEQPLLVPPSSDLDDQISEPDIGKQKTEAVVQQSEPAIENDAVLMVDEQLDAISESGEETVAAVIENEEPVKSEVAKEKEVFIELVGTSWVDVKDASGEFKLLGEMKEGQRHQFGGTPPYSILFGRAGAVKMVVDGKPYDFSSHKKGTVAKFTYNPGE